MIETQFTIAADHPSLKGHFPGNPIVPGVVILHEVIRCIKQAYPAGQYMAIPSVKFSAPLFPATTVKLNVVEKKPSLLTFTCRVEDGVICHGQIRMHQAD